ncbi:SDR family oxidoreductase [Bacteroidota bacterium]
MKINKSVLITGCSTGIGFSIATHLDSLGFKVFAGIRNEKDKENLLKNSSPLLEPVIIDVTNEPSIKEALYHISAETEYPLYGLVNNAGIGISGVVEATSVEAFRQLIEVNLLGLHAVTVASLPLLRKTKGRIVNIGSSSAFIAAPGGSAYAASKFAVRAYSDALRTEVMPFGMFVSLVSPGPIESDIWEKSLVYKKKLRANTSAELINLYQPFIDFGDKILERIKPIPAIHVAKKAEHALTAKNPKCNYLVHSDAKKAWFFSGFSKKFLSKMFLKEIYKKSKH